MLRYKILKRKYIKCIINLAIKTTFNSKINQVKGEILLKVKCLVLVIQSNKTDYNTKFSEMEKKITDHDHDKYITTPEFDKLTAENFAARLAQADLASKNYIAISVK